MPRAPRFTKGNRLDERFDSVAEDLKQRFLRAFPRLNDPAVVGNLVEESARRMAGRELRHGRVENLKPYFLKVFRKVARELLRRGYGSEILIDREGLISCAGPAKMGSPAAIESWVLIGEILRALDEKKKRILELHIRGYRAREIAQLVGTTEKSVTVYLTRAEAQIKTAMGPFTRL
jgi:DNA-directed RNA polymerase specialized sigma24 family protein